MCGAQVILTDAIALVPRRAEALLPRDAAVLRVLEGEAIIRCRSGPWRLGPGDVFIKPAASAGRIHGLEATRLRILGLAAQDLMGVGAPDDFAPLRLRCPELQRLLEGPPGEMTADASEALIGALRHHVAIALETTARIPAKRGDRREELYRRLILAREAMDRCDPPNLSLNDLAKAANLSPYHLHRTFSAAFGLTPLEYLRARRLRLALTLLADLDLPIGMVAEQCGFLNFPAFSRWFRQSKGMTPSDWRMAEAARRA